MALVSFTKGTFFLGQLLLGVLPEAQSTTHVHIQGTDDAELGNLDAVVQDAIVFLRNSFFLFAKQQDALGWEIKLMQHL